MFVASDNLAKVKVSRSGFNHDKNMILHLISISSTSTTVQYFLKLNFLTAFNYFCVSDPRCMKKLKSMVTHIDIFIYLYDLMTFTNGLLEILHFLSLQKIAMTPLVKYIRIITEKNMQFKNTNIFLKTFTHTLTKTRHVVGPLPIIA